MQMHSSAAVGQKVNAFDMLAPKSKCKEPPLYVVAGRPCHKVGLIMVMNMNGCEISIARLTLMQISSESVRTLGGPLLCVYFQRFAKVNEMSVSKIELL